MTDAELVAAIDQRPHWHIEGEAAVYAPPGRAAQVRIRPVLAPGRARERYIAAIVLGGTAAHATPWPTAISAVAWSERARLD